MNNASAIQTYELRVRGHLGETMRLAFAGMAIEARGADTALRGPLPDQSALFGLLVRVESLGLELVAVRRLPTGA